MKTNIHPTYYSDAQVTCVCGNSFITGSTKKTIQVDICSACHPFFTGEMKFVDTQGRVDKFQQKIKQASQDYISKKQRRKEKTITEEDTTPLSLRDMIQSKSKPEKKETKK